MPTVHDPAQTNELFKLIKVLYEEQERAWSRENPNNQKFAHCIDALQRHNWFKIDNTDMVKLEETWASHKTVDFAAVKRYGNKALFLPPLEKEQGFFVVMSLRCSMEPYSSQMRIMLITRKSDEELEEKPDNHFWAVGFRIETGTGMHRYHHAQLINDFKGDKNGLIFFDSIDWLPVSQPAFPLYATDPLTMMISLYITLYGLDRFASVVIEHGPKLKEIMKSPPVQTFVEIIKRSPPVIVAKKAQKKK